MLLVNEQQCPSHSYARISHQALLFSASTKAQARQSESDKTSQGRRWCLVCFTCFPPNLASATFLALTPLRCIQNLRVPELSPRKTNCRDIQEFLFSFFAAILYLDFKTLLPNNPTGNGRVDALGARYDFNSWLENLNSIWLSEMLPGSQPQHQIHLHP